MQPETDEEIPDYVVAMPSELPDLIHQLELQLKNRRILAMDQSSSVAL